MVTMRLLYYQVAVANPQETAGVSPTLLNSPNSAGTPCAGIMHGGYQMRDICRSICAVFKLLITPGTEVEQ